MARHLTVVALLLFAAALSGQTLQTGNIVLLKSNATGKYLSASLPETLSLSPNKAGWEQWKFSLPGIQGQPALLSHHGTVLSQDLNAKFRHAPFFHSPSEGGASTVAPVKQTLTSNGGTMWMVDTDGPRNGGQIIIGGDVNTLLIPSGDTVHYTVWLNGTGIPNAAIWTIVLVAPSDTNWKAMQVGMADETGFGIRSRHGSYLRVDQPIARNTTVPARHRTVTAARALLGTRNGDRNRALRYGDELHIAWEITAPPMNFIVSARPSSTHPAVLIVPGFTTDETRWKIIDPAGIYQQGHRLAKGANICLQARSGLRMSADPAIPEVRLSTNCSEWEWWSLAE